MSIRLLVLHGPNVPLRLEKEASTTLPELHRALKLRAKELGAQLRTAAVHGEEGLLATLFEQRNWADGVLLASGLLASSPAVKEALGLLGVPFVDLSAPVKGRVGALDQARYLEALAALGAQVSSDDAAKGKGPSAGGKAAGTTARAATPSRASSKASATATRAPGKKTSPVRSVAAVPRPTRGKTLGRRRAQGEVDAPVDAPTPSPAAAGPRKAEIRKTLGRPRTAEKSPKASTKTLGRRPRAASGPEAPVAGAKSGVARSAIASHRGLPTREAARAQLAARLSGELDAASLQAWAREGWARLEAAQSPDTRLSAVLLRLTAGGNPGDDRLITLMTELDR